MGKIDIVSAEGEPIITSNSDLKDLVKGKNNFNNSYGWSKNNINGSDLLITYYTVPSTGWKVISSIPYREITYDIDRATRYILIAFIIITMVFFTVFFMSALSTVIIPTKNLMKHMKRVEKGDFSTDIVIKGGDELAQLNRSFISMVNEIQNLIRKIEIEKTEKMRLEVRSLQYQINPHFLFNTLNTITMMASMHGVENIRRMTDSLTRLLMNTMDKGGCLITIEKEFENLNSYVHIMKVRYGDRFDVEYSMDSEVKHLYILKLLIQPILENSIIHGMGDVFTKIRIEIKACIVDTRIVITVSDDGVGMTNEQIEMLLSSERKNSKGFTKIGVTNVNRRIKLNYGECYGLKIVRGEGGGTVVVMNLPIIHTSGNDNDMGGEMDVQDIGCR